MANRPDKRKIASLESHIGYWLRLVSNGVSQSFAQELTGKGVTVAEWVFMRQLYDYAEARPSAIASEMGMTRGAISKLAERLLVKQLVNRKEETADRRYQSISLTESGRSLVEDLAETADANENVHFSCLEPEERQLLLTTLQKLAIHHQMRNHPTT